MHPINLRTKKHERFFAHAGFEEHAAQALADRSGDGHSPIPILIQYGQSHGLSSEETVEWINSLDKWEIDYVRDHLHHALDDIGGDLDRFPATHENDQEWLDDFSRAIRPLPAQSNFNPISTATTDFILESADIALPGS